MAALMEYTSTHIRYITQTYTQTYTPLDLQLRYEAEDNDVPTEAPKSNGKQKPLAGRNQQTSHFIIRPPRRHENEELLQITHQNTENIDAMAVHK